MGNLVFQATLGGQVNLVGPNTASTYNINVPAVAGTMVTTGDTGSVSSTMLASSLSLTTPNINVATGTSLKVTSGFYSTSSSSFTYTDGIVMDYTTGLGRISVGTSDGLAFYNAGVATTELMRLDSSGNLGIGTASPSGKLDAVGSLSRVRWNLSNAYAYQVVTNPADSAYATNRVDAASHDWYVSNSLKMTLDSSGNVGINLTPATQYSTVRGLGIAGTNGNPFYATSGAGQDGVLTSNAYLNASANFTYVNTDAVVQQRMSSGVVSWWNAPSGTAGTTATMTERARIDSSGNLLVGTTSFPNGVNGVGIAANGSAFSRSVTTAATQISFRNPNGEVGSIQTSGSATSYVTSSDYRLKNTIAPMTGALAKVQQLKPVTYKWNADGSDGEGFIAHELAEVVPQCVTGEKDAVDEEGNPVYQGIDTSFLVATLTAAIQEQQAIIQQLQADVAALKAPQ